MGQQRARKITDGVVELFVADLSPIQDRAPQQLKTLNLIIVTFSCLVTAPVLSPRPKDPCCANPGFVQRVFLCTSVVQQLESKPTRTCTSLSLDHLRGSCAGDCLIDLDHVSGTGEQVSPSIQWCLHLLGEYRGLIFMDCHILHSSSSKNAARSRSSAPSSGAQPHLSQLFTATGNSAVMGTCYSGKMALEQQAHGLAHMGT